MKCHGAVEWGRSSRHYIRSVWANTTTTAPPLEYCVAGMTACTCSPHALELRLWWSYARDEDARSK